MVEQERPLERGGWALEGMTEDRHVDRARVEAGENLAQAVGPCERVILEAAFLEAWGGREVVLCPKRNDEDVGVIRALVGSHSSPLRIDRGDALLTKLDALLGDVAVVQAYV